ncbi:MAG: T9SS type A sorting domain-containing protein, partial [Saprospiraceae bacterium]|nr:T9SS type A sorting domain-containing protein [Saprospiraceae bacterium]
DENPPLIRYSEAGIYPVRYRALIDTSGYWLSRVDVEQLDCGDLLNPPDLQLKVLDPEGEEVYSSEVIRNTDPPLSFDLNLPMGEGNYLIQVWDDDDGLSGGDDLCGTINFNRSTEGYLSDEELELFIDIIHPVDTVSSLDTVIVYEQPDAPLIKIKPEGTLCAGEEALLATNYSSGLQWYRGELPLIDGDSSHIRVGQPGAYWLTHTSENGCVAVSDSVDLEFADLPEAPVFVRDGNFLSLFEGVDRSSEFSLQWFLDGEGIEGAVNPGLCMETDGTYRLIMTNEQTGCSNFAEQTLMLDQDDVGCATTALHNLPPGIESIRVYPNPFGQRVYVELEASEYESATISLYDLGGKPVRSFVRPIRRGSQRWQLETESLSAGMYVIVLRTPRGIFRQRLVSGYADR